MGAPIFVDDGGSIQLKLALRNGHGRMEDLFDVDNNHTSEFQKSSGNSPYKEVMFFWLDEDGDMNPKTPAPSPFNNNVRISGDSNVSVETVRLNHGNQLTIRLIGANIDPVVKSNQHRDKRSYTVVNGGRISAITIDGTTTGIPPEAVYTCVVIK